MFDDYFFIEQWTLPAPLPRGGVGLNCMGIIRNVNFFQIEESS